MKSYNELGKVFRSCNVPTFIVVQHSIAKAKYSALLGKFKISWLV